MKPFLVLIIALLLVALTGCSYTPARIETKPIVEIDDGHDHHHAEHRRDGDFCPPGQAKKGRC
ncbi:hypothetical protein [Halomonas sp. WWR20]